MDGIHLMECNLTGISPYQGSRNSCKILLTGETMGQELSEHKSTQLAWEAAKHHQFMSAALFHLSENSFNMMARNLVFLTSFFFTAFTVIALKCPEYFLKSWK